MATIRNVIVNGRRTSLRLEQGFWKSLAEISDREQISVNQVCSLIDRHRGLQGLTPALRSFIIEYFRSAGGGSDRLHGMHDQELDDDNALSPVLGSALKILAEEVEEPVMTVSRPKKSKARH